MPSSLVLGASERERLAVLVRGRNVVVVAARIGVARESLMRALAGLPIRRGTAALLEAEMRRAAAEALEPLEPEVA